MKNILIMKCYFIFIVLLTPTLSNENEIEDSSACNPFDISDGRCSSNCTHNGKINFQLNKQECNDYYVNIDFKTKSSIINITATIKQHGIELDKREDLSEGNLIISVFEFLDDGSKKDILQTEWSKNQSNASIQRNYLSWTSNVFISILSPRNWSYYDIAFSFREIKYNVALRKDFPSASGDEEFNYFPNSVSLFRLTKESSSEWEGIEITVRDLNISEEVGEYLLIGSGTEIFGCQEYLPLYVTEVKQNSTFYVSNPTAYLAFVSGPIQKDQSFSISWNRVGIKTLPNEKDLSGLLNSAPVCFFNYSAAIEEFKNERFKTFRQHFSHFLNSYQDDNTEKTLDETSVEFIGQPIQVYIDGNQPEALSTLIKVVLKKKPAFTSKELQNAIESFQKNISNIPLRYKVIKCPHENKELSYKDEWSVAIYAMVPVFGVLALMIWGWKQNVFTQKYTSENENEEKLCPALTVLAESNTYEATIPKVCLYDSQQRQVTLIQGSSQPEGEKEDEVEMNALPSTSQELDNTSPSRYSSSRRSNRPSIKPLIENYETTDDLSNIGKIMSEGNESEHLYDSVNQEVDETKL